jgi:hypothetical protein
MSYTTRVPVIIKPEYVVSFERYNELTWIHCHVNKWSPAIRRNLSQDFESLVHLHDDPIYAIHEIGDTKHEKFLALFQFQFLQSIVGSDNVERHVYLRSK